MTSHDIAPQRSWFGWMERWCVAGFGPRPDETVDTAQAKWAHVRLYWC